MKKLLTLLTLLTLAACSIKEKDQEILVENHGGENSTNIGQNEPKPEPTPAPTPIPTVVPVAEAGLPFVCLVCFVVASLFPGCVVIVKRDLVLEPKANANLNLMAWKPSVGLATSEDSTNSVGHVEADNASETAAQVEGLTP